MKKLILVFLAVQLSACGGQPFTVNCAQLIAVAQPKINAINVATATKADVIAVMGAVPPGTENDSTYSYNFYNCRTYTFNFSGNFVIPSDSLK